MKRKIFSIDEERKIKPCKYTDNYYRKLMKKSQRERDKILSNKLELLTNKILNSIGDKKVEKAKLTAQVGAIDIFIKNRQLLSGKATEINKIDFKKMSPEEISDYLNSQK